MRTGEDCLKEAMGYLALGMAQEAHEALDRAPLEETTLTDLLSVRLAVCHALRDWKTMRSLSETLGLLDPQSPSWPLALAYATWRLHGAEAARRALVSASASFGNDPLVCFHLASYEAQTGRLEAARKHLSLALRLDARFLTRALNGGVFAVFHDELRRSAPERPLRSTPRSANRIAKGRRPK